MTRADEIIGKARALAQARLEQAVQDAAALDEINLLLSAPEWPGASGMEDVCDIVRRVREPVPDAPEWHRH